jgi:hypothetical protein
MPLGVGFYALVGVKGLATTKVMSFPGHPEVYIKTHSACSAKCFFCFQPYLKQA